MFIGHFAVGFAAKKPAPQVSLGTLFIAVQFLDLLWPIFLLAGIEQVRIDPGNTVVTPLEFYNYPYTHSMAMALFWSVLVGALYFAVKKNARGAVIVGAGVFSHWVLDFITHRPDLPLYPGSDVLLGLGLWNSIPATVVVEGALFAGAVYLYATMTRAKNRAGTWGFWSLVALVVVIYLSNLFGPPPSDTTTIAYVTLAMWAFVPWLYWIDRQREVH